MKKIISSSAILFLVVLTAGLILMSCSKEPPNDEIDGTSGQKINIKLSEYSIVYPLKSSALEEGAAELLRFELESLCGESVSLIDDYTNDESVKTSDAKEILISDTNREASAQAASALGDGWSWSVELVGQRIVVSATNDTLLHYAVRELIENCSFEESGCLSIPESLSLKQTVTELLTLSSAGTSNYPILFPDESNDALVAAYKKLQAAIESAGKVKQQPFDSDIISKASGYDSGPTELLIGNTAYSESAAGLDLFSPYEYGYTVVGNKLVVGGSTLQSTVLAVDHLADCIRAGKQTDENGNISIVIPGKTLRLTNPGYRSDIPPIELEPIRTVDVGDGGITNCYSVSELSVYEGYCASVAESGFKEIYKNEFGEKNRYAAFEKGKTRLFVSFTAGDQLRITTEPTKNLLYLGERVEGDMTPMFTQRVLSYTADSTNGMGYVLRLSDGSFVIWDGGFKADAEKLNDYLSSKTPNGEKPHIRLWILTHMHGDHIQCFNEFAARYAGGVKLDFVGTAMPDELTDPESDSASWTNGRVPDGIKKFDGAKHALMHTGDVIDFGDVKIEVMQTYSTLLCRGYRTSHHNDASVVTRVVSSSTSILLTADIQTSAGKALVDEQGGGIRSHYCQVAHHGSVKWPTTIEVYGMAAPQVALFPGSSERYKENKTSTENKYIIDAVGEGSVIVADGKDYDIILK